LSGLPCRGVPASELWLYADSAYPKNDFTLLVAVSRSGATTETIQACRAFKASKRGDLVTLSCYPDQVLANLGDLNLVLPAGAENSVAQTRAFSTLYLGTAFLAGVLSNQAEFLANLGQLPEAGSRLIKGCQDTARLLGQDLGLERFYFLGSGLRYGLACELSLKMKEMTLSHSEPFHFMEFRHGPMSMVTDQTLLIGLLSESNRSQELAVLNEMQARGARTLTIGSTGANVAFSASLEERTCGVLYLPVGQLMAFERSIKKGLNPDKPHNLTAVVKLE